VPTATVTHTEPFHVSTAIATLDYVSSGRAGWRAQVSRAGENQHFGRRETPQFRIEDYHRPEVRAAAAGRFDEARDFVEVVRRLWDSWEDDAEIRDAATGRFIDRGKLHYIDFEGSWFSVRGPSITPRPPQGQPVVTALGHATIPYRFGARSADVIYITPRDAADAAAITQEIRAEQQAAGRADETVHVFADLVVFLDGTSAAATDRKARLDELAGGEYRTAARDPQARWDELASGASVSDALIFAGTPAELADTLQDWQRAGLSGFRLRPGVIPHDLRAITQALVPELQQRQAFRTQYEAATLRGLLGLPRPANRYAATATAG
jgi:alkanesulfonate monooxygenase SsuD/methylene tetrahydromethanopterin reductase-like flavin-dependent oxidoreductase (luciferase family)